MEKGLDWADVRATGERDVQSLDLQLVRLIKVVFFPWHDIHNKGRSGESESQLRFLDPCGANTLFKLDELLTLLYVHAQCDCILSE